MNDSSLKLAILSKLAGGVITPEDADRQLDMLDKGRTCTQEGSSTEQIKNRLYSLLDIPDEQDNEDDIEEYGEQDDENDMEEYQDQSELIDEIDSGNVLDIVAELIDGYDLDPDEVISDILPLIPDTDDNLTKILEMFQEGVLDQDQIEGVADAFAMTDARIAQLIQAAADMGEESLTGVLRRIPQHTAEISKCVLDTFWRGAQGASADCLCDLLGQELLQLDDAIIDDFIAMLGSGVIGSGNNDLIRTLMGKKAGRKPVRAEVRRDVWENVWKDCFAKDAQAIERYNRNGWNHNSPFPSYESLSIEFPERAFEKQQETVQENMEADINVRNVRVTKACRLRGVDARDFRVEADTVCTGEVRCNRIEARSGLKFENRACFDRLSAEGQLESCDLMVGNSVDVRGDMNLGDIQARVICLNGSGSIHGIVKSAALTASGNIEFCDTIRSMEISLDGDIKILADMHVGRLNIKGKAKAQRELWATDLIRAEGTAVFNSRISCKRLSASGMLTLEQGINCCYGAFELSGVGIFRGKLDDAMSVGIIGSITATDIGGLLNWTKTVDITMSRGDSRVDNIAAVTTRVDATDNSRLTVGSIGGYSIDVKNTDAESLKANYVAVGQGCHIKLLQYINAVTVHPDAVVERMEKISPS